MNVNRWQHLQLLDYGISVVEPCYPMADKSLGRNNLYKL
jgi:hypothetical protein